jgi:hypothetical protein
MRGSFASLKNCGMTKFESDLERKVFCLLEFAPAVLRYSQQPPSVQICVAGRVRRYTPDVAVQWRSGATWIVEVKPSEHVADPAWQERFAAARAAAQARGQRFVIVTDEHVGLPGMKDVMRWLELRRRDRTVHLGDRRRQASSGASTASASAMARLEYALEHRDRLSASEARRLLGDGALGAQALEELLAMRHVVAPLTERVCDTTPIHAYTEADDELLFA